MSNTITIQLCAEDRARLDRLAAAMEKHAGDILMKDIEEPETEETAETTAAPEQARSIDRAELRAKVIELSAKGLKEQTRDIVREYAQTVTAVPDDKLAECYDKLMALGG